MKKSRGYTILLSCKFERTEHPEGVVPLYVGYRMTRVTAFGVIEAADSVLFSVFEESGATVTDGVMFRALSEQIHKEETARLLESAATSDFGEEASLLKQRG